VRANTVICNLLNGWNKSELIAHRVCNTLLYIQIQYIHTFMLIHRIRHKKIMKAKIHGVACMKFETKSTHKLIYFTTITKQVIQLILSMLVGTDVCVRMVFVWEETGVPGGKPTCLTWWPYDTHQYPQTIMLNVNIASKISNCNCT